MPTSLFSEIDRCTNGVSNSIEEQRALQLAFELSMLGLDQSTPGCPGTGTSAVPGANTDPDPLQNPPNSVFEEARSKKSQNMTECVPVPSSEHVAEIVGRQEYREKVGGRGTLSTNFARSRDEDVLDDEEDPAK
ncbi:hypothetical protein M0804_003531 [Polistes exclamans]|nr:hypothetical protein M0804_003531 [Polistes exclamans]